MSTADRRPSSHRGEPRPLELYIGAAYLLAVAMAIGFGALWITGTEDGPAHPYVAYSFAAVMVISCITGWALHRRDERSRQSE